MKQKKLSTISCLLLAALLLANLFVVVPEKAVARDWAAGRVRIQPDRIGAGESVTATINNPVMVGCTMIFSAPGSNFPTLTLSSFGSCQKTWDFRYDNAGTFSFGLVISYVLNGWPQQIRVNDSIVVTGPRAVRFSANPTSVNQNQNITLSFQCQNSPRGARIENSEQGFTSPVILPPGNGSSVSDSITTVPTVVNQGGSTYTLICLGGGTSTASLYLPVVVNPSGTPIFYFQEKDGKTEVEFNGSVILQWSKLRDVTSCDASSNRPALHPNWNEENLPISFMSQQRTIRPIVSGVTFTLTCYNGIKGRPATISSSQNIVITLTQNGYLVFGGNNKIQAAVFAEGTIGINGGNDTFTGSFVARNFNDLSNLVNIRFNYDYNLSRNWPPGFRYLNMPQPAAN